MPSDVVLGWVRVVLSARQALGWGCAAALLLVAGCAPSAARQEPIISDPAHGLSAERWEIYGLPGDVTLVASISDPSYTLSFGVICKDPLKPLGLIITSIGEPPLAHPDLDIFIDGVPADLLWIPVSDEKTWGFGALSGRPGFWTVIDDLKRHKSIEAVLRESEKQLHYHFAWSQADKAIGYVEQQCDASHQT